MWDLGAGCQDILVQGSGAGHRDSWVVFQKKCQSKNQFQSTARGGGLSNPPESTIGKVVVTPPTLVVTITTRCKGKGWW